LAQRSQEVKQPPDGKITCPVPRQRRYLGLWYPKNLSGVRLGEATRLDDAVDLKGQPSLHQCLLCVGQSQIGKHIPAAFDNLGLPGGFTFSLHFACGLFL
jgi:hypothetical protein